MKVGEYSHQEGRGNCKGRTRDSRGNAAGSRLIGLVVHRGHTNWSSCLQKCKSLMELAVILLVKEQLNEKVQIPLLVPHVATGSFK